MSDPTLIASATVTVLTGLALVAERLIDKLTKAKLEIMTLTRNTANIASVKQEEIHTLVNSNLTAVKDELEEAKMQIQELKNMLKARTS
jgi:hypothetical protein